MYANTCATIKIRAPLLCKTIIIIIIIIIIVVIIYMIYEEALYKNKFKLRVESFVTQETQLTFTFCFLIIFFREKNKDLTIN